MQKDRLEKVIEVFNSALELEDADRKAFVEEELDRDEDLKKEVFELLRSHKEANGFMQNVPSEIAAEAIGENNSSAIGKQIGSYKLEKQIGYGGMGTVYLATRADEQFEQKVAVKLLKRGMDTDKIIQRFMYERQILADLNHPNIAKLLDGGTTEDGLPYFVLEYIEGVPITEYCRTKNLSLNE